MITAILVTGFVVSAGGTVQGGDGYPDRCDEAPIVNSTGIVKGVIDSPDDQDAIKVEIPKKGDFVAVAPVIPKAETELHFDHYAESSFSLYNETDELEIDTGNQFQPPSVRHPGNFHRNGSWEIWSETTGEPVTICIEIYEFDDESSDIPYEYALRLEAESPEPVTIAEELTRLRQIIEQKNETIYRLRNNTTSKQDSVEIGQGH